MFWAGVKKVDPMKKLEAICREAGDVRSFNKWRGKHRDIDLNAVLVVSFVVLQHTVHC